MIWFDAHLDLACLAVNKRDMLLPLDRAMAPWPPAACTLASLREGDVELALATIFTEPDGTGPEGYAAGDVERAHFRGRAQLEVYHTWRDAGAMTLDLRACLSALTGLSQTRGGMGVGQSVPLSGAQMLSRMPKTRGLRIGLLMENADPIRSPRAEDVAWWVSRGLVAVGLAWAKSSRYAGGNSTNDGLTTLGIQLVKELDRQGVVHDASHLSDRAFDDLLGLTDRTLIASHSNCRAITDPTGANQRHLTDAQITEIARRGGVVGLNVYSKFLRPELAAGGRATISQFVEHAQRVAELAEKVSPFSSGRRHVALGTDLDGGFPADRLPMGIDQPRDYVRILEGLADVGWTEKEQSDFAHGNWLRVLTPA